jgi:beta-lactamase class A
MVKLALSICAALYMITVAAPSVRAPGSIPSPRAQRIAAIKSAAVQIQAAIAASGAEVAVYWHPLKDISDSPVTNIAINAKTRFHAASTMKVPIMMELFRQAQLGRLKLDDTLVVTNQFTSIVDGSPYTLSISDDSDAEVYKAVGKPVSLRQLCEAMITVSSNLAANLLIDRLGAKTIQQNVDGLGASGMQVLRGVEDQKAFDKGLNNTTDATGLGTLLLRIGRNEVPGSAEMIDILARQKFNDGIPAGVPPGTRVAHKTGWITRIRHDAAIVYGPEPYVLVVLTRGIEDPRTADGLIAKISQLTSRVSFPGLARTDQQTIPGLALIALSAPGSRR